MRIAFPVLVVAGAFAPVPALAAEGDAARVAGELNDPVRQAQMAAAVEAVTTAVLAMPAALLLRAAETMAGRDPEAVDPNLTVGDLAGAEAAEAPHVLAQRLPELMGAMAAMSAALATMLPELQAMGERMAEDMARSRE